MATVADKGGKRRLAGSAKKARVPVLFAAGLPHAEIAAELRVSKRQVERWGSDPEVKAEVASLVEEARQVTKTEVTQLASKAVSVLEELLDSEDEHVRMKAVDSALDRFGHPKRSESKSEVEHSAQPGSAIAVMIAGVQEQRAAKQLARGEDEGEE